MAISESGPTREKFKKGDFIGQKYEVYDVLGEGGFGIVYLVYFHEDKAVLALKTFRDEYIEDIKTRERFKKEAQVWIDLERHPYLVRALFVHDIAGRLFIAMEPIFADEPGMNTIEGYLRRRPPDLAQSLRWAIQFCHGMEYAYSKGVKAHRDIKPSNIMIDQNKTVKITDFGLAGVLPQSSIFEQSNSHGKIGNDALMQTVIGTSIGTPEYMSPEQFENLSSCDERSDIYSFGIVLYQMASGGRLPFCADNPTYRWPALKHLHQETPIPKLNTPLIPLIQRCLEKEPRRRYQTFSDLRADLEPLLKQQTGEIVKLPEKRELEVWELVNKGASLNTLDKPQDAIVCYDRALEINPRYAVAWHNKGVALDAVTEYQKVIACFNKALEINPKFADAWYSKGNALGSFGKYQEAIACYDKVLEINPIDADAWYNKGVSLSKLGKYQEAIACYDKALEINPVYVSAWNNKGAALRDLGKYQEVLACFNKALEINPKFADAWVNKGNELAKLAKYEEAIACYDKALEIDPRYADAWYNKGFLLTIMGNDNEAIHCCDKSLEINPKCANAWYSKGNALESLGKYQEAIACYDKAININPRYADAWYSKGNALRSLGKYQEATACYNKAIEINPGDEDAWYNKGVAEDKLHKTQAAIISYKQFLGLASKDNDDSIAYARKRLKELEGK